MKEFPTIDEKIASGLMKQFWAEMVHRQNLEFGRAAEFNSNKKLIAKVKGKGSWKDQLKWVADSFHGTQLLTYFGGSERRPYLGLSVLYALKEREYNSWNERCLIAHVLLTSQNPVFAQTKMSLFNIGEHAISRLFLRKQSHVREDNGLVKIDSILDDIRPLCAWSAFWYHRVIRSKLLFENRSHLAPIVPTKHGLFLCRFSSDIALQLEVRTFIGLRDLNKSQQEIHKAMAQAGDEFLVSPLPFSPFVEKLGYDYPKLITRLICLRLHSHAHELGNQLVEKINDSVLAHTLRDEFAASLERGKGLPDHESLLSEIGIESYLAAGRNAARKDAKSREFLMN